MESCRRHTTLLWAVCLILSIICVNVRIASAERLGDLSDYELASFDNPDILGENERRASKFNHFTLSDHGDVYVGAVNWLYWLNGSLGEIQNVTTCNASKPDSMPCHLTNNYNKILVVDSTRPDSLITCGGVYDGICQSRQLHNISNMTMESVTYVAGYEDASTVSVIAPGRDGNQMLYVAVTFTGENKAPTNFPAVARRTLANPLLSATNLFNTVPFDLPALQMRFVIKYFLTFAYRGFTYFVTSQKEDLTDSAQFVSKMSRVCQTGPNLDAYTEITLQCSGSGDSVYSLVQAAHFGPAGPDLAASLGLHADEQVLYAVFARNQGAPGTSDVPIDHSALCVYRMTDILAAFKEAVRGCIQPPMPQPEPYKVDYLAGSFCSSFSIVQESTIFVYVTEGRARFYPFLCNVCSSGTEEACTVAETSQENKVRRSTSSTSSTTSTSSSPKSTGAKKNEDAVRCSSKKEAETVPSAHRSKEVESHVAFPKPASPYIAARKRAQRRGVTARRIRKRRRRRKRKV
ncbi:plexin-B-like [Patiria miniata]|uniref:Sema domain-containing protein n=1 Tax=Patiria miniata TaxID=46514 RepID=A0A914ACN3_PATMI|nr:plexin-B-like [Patiria miniata]